MLSLCRIVIRSIHVKHVGQCLACKSPSIMSEIFIILPILQMSKLSFREAKARVQDHRDDGCQSQLFNSDPQCLDPHPIYHVSRAVLLPLRLISSHSRPRSKVSSSPISQVKKLRARVHMELARGPTASKRRIP